MIVPTSIGFHWEVIPLIWLERIFSITEGAAVESYFQSRTISSSNLSNVAVQQFGLAAIPEPSIYAMLSGLLALGWVMARRRQS
ncbi:MAG TPA: hypothetical protein DEA90_08630 [Opitutae bacterium]|nr:hypothetical protein [Puniceicoccaceae bacterium]HBR94215.1 hypothetical protein [Opitutae bacterium]|tara:strand:+ start:597 stop:848 length:252 start_codon:yes stop_codon:yes gene_type:complete